MDLLLIRHADAEPAGVSGIEADAERPLTEKGRGQCTVLAAALQRHAVRPARVLTSPLLRARETAEGLLRHWVPPAPEVEVCDVLAPGGKRRKLTRRLRDLDGDLVALVGHMPDLAIYASWLIGSKKADVDLAKSGVALIRFDGKLGKKGGVLAWLIPPEWFTG